LLGHAPPEVARANEPALLVGCMIDAHPLPPNFMKQERGTPMKRRLLHVLVVAATLLPAGAYSQTSRWTIDPMHSGVNFEIVHMGVSHVHGAFGSVKGIVTLMTRTLRNRQ
jgi:hypothetical protein